MKRYLFFIIIFFISTFSPVYSQGIISINTGGVCSDEDRLIITPNAGILTGFDYFNSITDSISFFTSIGGSINYRYLDEEWNYLYNGSTHFSFRGDHMMFKPSITLRGEHFYDTELAMPHMWENSCDLYFSYDIGASSAFFDPAFSWENENYFFKGIAGYIFPFYTKYVLSLEFLAGKTLFESAQDETFIYPRILFSWYPHEPYTLSASFAFTWYDSDYESPVGDSGEFLQVYDFIKFFSDIEYSVIFGEDISLTIYVPLSLTLKHHQAIEEEALLDENEWIFNTGLQVDVGIDVHPSHRCIISLSGEKSFSNTTYQESREIVLSIAYEFFF